MIPTLIKHLEEAVHIANDLKMSERMVRKWKYYGLDTKPELLDKGEIGSGANFVKMVKDIDTPMVITNHDGKDIMICDHKFAKDLKSIVNSKNGGSDDNSSIGSISYDHYHVYFVSKLEGEEPSMKMVPKFKIKDALDETGFNFDDDIRHIYQLSYASVDMKTDDKKEG